MILDLNFGGRRNTMAMATAPATTATAKPIRFDWEKIFFIGRVPEEGA